jgi:hypothetical protein
VGFVVVVFPTPPPPPQNPEPYSASPTITLPGRVTFK